jgi:hypothetical protein
MEVYADRFAEAQGYYQSYNYCEGIQWNTLIKYWTQVLKHWQI